MSLPLQLFAPVSQAALLTRDYLRSQLARRTDPEQVLSKDGLKGIQSPFHLTSTKGSRDHHLVALTYIPDGQSCERSTFQITGLVVGKQLIMVQGRSVLCYSFTDNTRHWYLNSTPVVAVAKYERRWGGNTFSPQRGFSTRDSWDLGRLPLAGDSLCAMMFWCSDLTWPDSRWDWFYSW